MGIEILGTVDEILRLKGGTVWSISPEATVFDAIQVMSDRNVGALLVMEGEKLVGVVSERDYTRKVALRGKASRTTLVKEILSCNVIFAQPSATVEECLRTITEHRIRHLPVLHEGKVLGVVSIGDLVNWVISSQSATIEQLQSYLTGQYSA